MAEVAQVVDYSFAHPDPAAIKQAGYAGVMRYLAPLPNPKVLTGGERDELLHEGLSIGLVWESTGNRAGQGTDAGTQDAMESNRQADVLGCPPDAAIYYAVDFDAEPTAVRSYFAGIRAHAGRKVGVYGSLRVVEAMLNDGLAEFGWQTVAWSHGQVSIDGRVVLYQRATPTKGPVAGTDENACLAPDWGQWPRPSQPVPPSEDNEMAVSLVRIPTTSPVGPGSVWTVSGSGRWYVQDGGTELVLDEFLIVHGGAVTDLKPEDVDAFLRIPVTLGSLCPPGLEQKVS